MQLPSQREEGAWVEAPTALLQTLAIATGAWCRAVARQR